MMKIFDKLLLLGLLVSPADGYLAASPLLKTDTINFSATGENTKPLYITPAGEFILQPRMPLSVDLALGLEHKKTDIVTSFLFAKNNFLSALTQNIDTDNFINLINVYSSQDIPSNILTNIKDWDKQYHALELKPAVVLKAHSPILSIIQESGILEPYTYMKPSQDVWVLDPTKENLWRQALSKLDITHIPELATSSHESDSSDSPGTPDSPPENIQYFPTLPQEDHPLAEAAWTISPEETPYYLEELHKKAVNLEISDEDKATLFDHIQRKIILRASQLRSPVQNGEFNTARGLEHNNKVRLCKSAISNPTNLLEITHSQNGKITKVLIQPIQIEKSHLASSKAVAELVLTGRTSSDTDPISILVRKISHIKRIETSLL